MKEIKVPKTPIHLIPGKLLFEVVVGSHLHLTDIEDSDVDMKGVYLANENDVLCGTVQKTIVINDDHIYYEVGHFIDLLQKGNPTVIEMMFAPKNFVTFTDSFFERNILNRKMFFPRIRFGKSVLGTVNEHLKSVKVGKEEFRKFRIKANLKVSTRPESFCTFAYTPLGAQELQQYLAKQRDPGTREVKNYVTAPIKGMGNMRKLYYDRLGHFEGKGPFDEKGNLIDYNVPISYAPVGFLYYDEEGYKQQSAGFMEGWKKYKSIMDEQNDSWATSLIEGEKVLYDTKRILTCIRLLDTAIEFYRTKHMKVSRTEQSEYYKSIRRNEQGLEDLLLEIVEKRDHLSRLLKEKESVDPHEIQPLLLRHMKILMRNGKNLVHGYDTTTSNKEKEKKEVDEIPDEDMIYHQWTD